MEGRIAVKAEAEDVYVAILPEQKRGIALKILDGGTRASERASEVAITALLFRQGALERSHPVVERFLIGAHENWRGFVTGQMGLAPGFG